MGTIQKRYGVTLSLYLDGQGYDSSLDMYCEHHSGTAYKCPSAISDVMPMEEGSMCVRKRDGKCPCYDEQLAALKRAKSVIAARIKEVEEEAANAW